MHVFDILAESGSIHVSHRPVSAMVETLSHANIWFHDISHMTDIDDFNRPGVKWRSDTLMSCRGCPRWSTPWYIGFSMNFLVHLGHPHDCPLRVFRARRLALDGGSVASSANRRSRSAPVVPFSGELYSEDVLKFRHARVSV